MSSVLKPFGHPENLDMALQQNLETEGIMMSEQEYLMTEPASEVRREYIDGRAYAMAGTSINHARITGNIFSEIRVHLKGKPCEAFTSDIKVPLKIALDNDYVYPDVVVDCSTINGSGYFSNSPTLIIEVLSQSTRKRDLTTKLLRYINLPSLQEYVLIEQDFVQVQVLRKSNDWKHDYYYLGDSVIFESIGLTLSVEDIYDRVDNNEMLEFIARHQSSVQDNSLNQID